MIKRLEAELEQAQEAYETASRQGWGCGSKSAGIGGFVYHNKSLLCTHCFIGWWCWPTLGRVQSAFFQVL